MQVRDSVSLLRRRGCVQCCTIVSFFPKDYNSYCFLSFGSHGLLGRVTGKHIENRIISLQKKLEPSGIQGMLYTRGHTGVHNHEGNDQTS